MRNFNCVLVANRGEIALRVMHCARRLGLRTVAVYSDADADAPHRHYADSAVAIGGAAAADSYLQAQRIIEAAKSSGADAIHPGYGLLSENPLFAQAVTDAGLVFVGPPASAMTLMADKARAKIEMRAAGVPCVPGYDGDEQTAARFMAEAGALELPLMLKAAAGGGGRGMRQINALAALPEAFEAARAEAVASFGDGTLLMEQAVRNAKHVEIQVFADTHGHVIHLFERDCSVQRRHQKVIEEAPCPLMTPALRADMGAAAVAAARAVDYVGAGTVEFLLDDAQQFYFLEMNTRLQVEHPVTELITALDLVEWQLRVADGETLPLTQDQIAPSGHAIEVRLCAEAPARDFLPDTGPITLWRTPDEAVQFDVETARSAGVRVDAGIVSGGEVSPYYDSMVAKVMAYGRTREDARRRLLGALEGTALLGPACNRDFLLTALSHPAFVDGSFTTDFISQHLADYGDEPLTTAELALAAALLWRLKQHQALSRSVCVNPELLGWGSAGALLSTFDFGAPNAPLPVDVQSLCSDALSVCVREQHHAARVTVMADSRAVVVVDDVRYPVSYGFRDARTLDLATPARIFSVCDIAGQDQAASDESSGGHVRAPMHGRVLEVFVTPGQPVTEGMRIAVLEAMKMQHDILASVDGTVQEVRVEAGAQIAAQELLAVIQEAQA